ncbi:MAG TPA: TonB-dependent receptor, partial [Acidobacteriaceae bacterium]
MRCTMPANLLKADTMFRPLAIVFTVACLSCGTKVQAQSTGATLSGRITDASGATLRATVLLKNKATGVERRVYSESDGLYTVLSMDAGVYLIHVTSSGFGPVVQDSVKLDVGSTRELNFSMVPGSVSQQIEVTAASADVETDTAIVSATVGQKRIVDLPLNGRDWTQLATLQPGVISIRAQQPTTGNSNRGARGFGNQLASNGHSPYENTYRIDGINENDYSNGAPGDVIGANLGVDAIEEFNVVTTAYTAEYGRTSGAVINAITRSGTNQIHGSAYVFDRDKIFDAKNFFDNPAFSIPPFHRVQFGGTLGAPIRRDHTFIFVNYEGIRQSQSQPFISIVPSATARTGQIHDSNGVLTPVKVSPNIVPYLALYPLPNGALSSFGDTGIYNSSALLKLKENFVQTRFDQTFSDKDSLSLTYLYDNGPETLPDALGNVLNELSVGRDVAAISERHIFGPNLVNVLRVGYNRSLGHILTPVSALNPAAADHSLAYTPNAFAPFSSVTGLTSTGGLGSLRQAQAHYNSIQFNDDVSLTRGVHSLKTGFAYEHINADVQGKNQNGTATFDGLSQFLTGTLRSALYLPSATTNPVEAVDNLFAGYSQDDWRVRRNLTVSLGFRYEFLTIPYDKKDRAGLILNPVAAPSAASPFACPAVVSATTVPGCVVPVKQFWQTNPTTHNFEPRVGFSYSPYKNGNTAIRGAFGIYDMLP